MRADGTGSYGQPSGRLRVAFAVVGSAILVTALARQLWLIVPSSLMLVVLAALWQWWPPLHVDRTGFKRQFRRRVPWSRVVRMRGADRWRPTIQVQLEDGRVVDLPGTTGDHLVPLHRLAGLEDEGGAAP